MTAQIPEVLIDNGQRHALRACPLESYFERSGARPALQLQSTALWRRYVGTWEIVDERLYLIDIRGTLANGAPLRLADLFSGHPERVFAEWFDGDVNIPEGGVVDYVHAGFASRYEREEVMTFQAGVRTQRMLRTHGQPRARWSWIPFSRKRT